ncbi:MAG: L-2-hydroxyglutarate oxidase [Solirubrobacterales bacterium]
MSHADPEGEADLVVVGAGIVGLATARAISRRHPRLSIRVLEREDRIAAHQTSHNSGVIHAGIYYKSGSLKATLCSAGLRSMTAFCETRGLPIQKVGKVIVATRADELPRLEELERRGAANGVPGLRRIDADELAEIEPHVNGIAALHSPATAIADFAAVAQTYADDLADAGGRVDLGCEVHGVDVGAGRVAITHARGELRARHAIFCAGAWSDRLAGLAGAPAEPRMVPFRGGYLRLAPERRNVVRGNVYPVPDPELPFLGMHLTPTVHGEVILGPSALMVAARDAYNPARVRARDLADIVTWPGSWKLARRWWRTGAREIRQAASRRVFIRELQRFVPELQADDVLPGWGGVRGQALARDGGLVDDFVVSPTERVLHVRNAPSPAATSSLEIAELIADRAESELGVGA